MAERLASFEYRALGRRLRPVLEQDGRGWRVLADEIGVTPSDLSRVMAGQPLAAHKVIAICDWLGIDLRDLYRPGCFTANALKQRADASTIENNRSTP